MDKDVHSDEGRGVTSLGYPGHLMTDAFLFSPLLLHVQ